MPTTYDQLRICYRVLPESGCPQSGSIWLKSMQQPSGCCPPSSSSNAAVCCPDGSNTASAPSDPAEVLRLVQKSYANTVNQADGDGGGCGVSVKTGETCCTGEFCNANELQRIDLQGKRLKGILATGPERFIV